MAWNTILFSKIENKKMPIPFIPFPGLKVLVDCSLQMVIWNVARNVVEQKPKFRFVYH